MRRTVQAGVLLAVMTVALPALACRHRSHGHVGAGDVIVGLALAPLFGLDVRVHHAPCAQAVVVQPPVVQVAPPVYVAPPPVYVAPPPPPPVYVAPAVVAPAVVAAPAPAPAVQRRVDDGDRPAALGAKFLGGAVGLISVGDGVQVDSVGRTGSFGLEYRVSRWFALRSDFEAHPGGRSFDIVGGKLWLRPRGMLRPYGSVSLSASDSNAEPGRLAFGVVGAAGLDLFLGRHFFLEAEARYRVAPNDCCRAAPQLSGHLGGGIAFF